MSLSSRRLWLFVVSLIIFDTLLVTAMTYKPSEVAYGDQATWDFRISELRQLETTTGYHAKSTLGYAKQAEIAAYFPHNFRQNQMPINGQLQALIAAVTITPSSTGVRGQVL